MSWQAHGLLQQAQHASVAVQGGERGRGPALLVGGRRVGFCLQTQKQPAAATVGRAVFSVGNWRFLRRESSEPLAAHTLLSNKQQHTPRPSPDAAKIFYTGIWSTYFLSSLQGALPDSFTIVKMKHSQIWGPSARRTLTRMRTRHLCWDPPALPQNPSQSIQTSLHPRQS